MSMTHKEALEVVRANIGFLGPDRVFIDTISAYIEARGLALVPREPTGDMRFAMDTELPFTAYENMLAAAPDPLKEGE